MKLLFRKEIRIAIFLLFPNVLFSQVNQKECTIVGNLGKISPFVSKVYLQYTDALHEGSLLTRIDSTLVSDSAYIFKINFFEPGGIFITIKFDKEKLIAAGLPIPPFEERIVEYFLDTGIITINTVDFPFSNSVCNGSLAYEQIKSLDKKLMPFSIEKMDSIRSALNQNGSETATYLSFKSKLEAIQNKRFSLFKTAINEKNSHIRAAVFKYYVLNEAKKAPLDMVSRFYSSLTKEAKKHPYAIQLKNYIDFIPGVEAPGFTRTTSENKKISLRDFKGKYVYLDFWGSWCKPCREKHPELNKIYEKYRNKNFEIIGIAKEGDGGNGITKEEAINKWLTAIKTDSLLWPNVLYKSDNISEVSLDVAYRVLTYPSGFLIDPNGKILEINPSLKDLANKLDNLLTKK